MTYLCDHEEADSYLILHIADSDKMGIHNILLRTTDTDFVVLPACASNSQTCVNKLWIVLGTGECFHNIAKSHIPVKSNGFTIFSCLHRL